LLVVIAISRHFGGSVAAGVEQVKERAQKTSCLSNLRQCGLALQIYAGHNNDFYPLAPRSRWSMSSAILNPPKLAPDLWICLMR